MRPAAALPISLIALSVIFAVFSTNITIRGAFAIIAISSIAYLCFRRPQWGCLLIIVVTLILDDTVRQFSTITHDLGYYFYSNWWKLVSPEGERKLYLLKFNSIEIIMIATGLGVAFEAKRKKRQVVVTPELLLGFVFIAAVTAMFIWGVLSGGETKQALWQVRSYFQLLVVCILIAQTTRTECDLRLLTWTLLAAGSAKAAQVIWMFLFMANGRFGSWRQIIGHEDSVFFVAAMSLACTLLIYDRRLAQRLLLCSLSLVLAVATLLNLRRAGYAAFGLTTLLMPLVAHQRRKIAIGLTLALSVGVVIYLILFWHSAGTLGVPAQKVRSVFAATSGTTDFNSNIYRSAENINLSYTIVHNPLGTGFGKPFELHVPMDDISRTAPDWQYHPHNMILGLWMSLGTIGFAIYLTFVGSVMAIATFAARISHSDFTRAVAIFGLLALAAGLFAGAVDAFIGTQRGAIFLGIVVGMISAISSMQGRTILSFRRRGSDEEQKSYEV
jgi:hypothetical protein